MPHCDICGKEVEKTYEKIVGMKTLAVCHECRSGETPIVKETEEDIEEKRKHAKDAKIPNPNKRYRT